MDQSEIQYSLTQALIALCEGSMTPTLKLYSPVFISVVITLCDDSRRVIASPPPVAPENLPCMGVFVLQAIREASEESHIISFCCDSHTDWKEPTLELAHSFAFALWICFYFIIVSEDLCCGSCKARPDQTGPSLQATECSWWFMQCVSWKHLVSPLN